MQLGNDPAGENVAMNVDCVAVQARPRPQFKWFIGTTEIQGEMVDSAENESNDGKADYIQTMKYLANAKHNGQILRCEVEHLGYTEAQKAEGANVITKNLELYCKCWTELRFLSFKVGF